MKQTAGKAQKSSHYETAAERLKKNVYYAVWEDPEKLFRIPFKKASDRKQTSTFRPLKKDDAGKLRTELSYIVSRNEFLVIYHGGTFKKVRNLENFFAEAWKVTPQEAVQRIWGIYLR